MQSRSMPARLLTSAILGSALANRWSEWQTGVVTVLRTDFQDILADIGSEDVDWEAWRSLYEEGRSPRSAVYHALARDLEFSQ